jgi:hypothetical protein
MPPNLIIKSNYPHFKNCSYQCNCDKKCIIRKEPLTSVELLATMGLKYIHATNAGKNQNDGDFEKSKKLVKNKIEN